MSELGRLSWCSLSVVGAILFLASANVSSARHNNMHICCDTTNGACTEESGVCGDESCSADDVCKKTHKRGCSSIVGACMLPDVGCTIMSISCMAPLNCVMDPSCLVAPLPDESSDEPVCHEDKDRADTDEAMAETTSDRATWPVTVLLLAGLVLLPAAPMVIRWRNGRK